MESYNIIGLMSGTSADGLDVVLCRFEGSDYNWKYTPIKAKTYEYDSETKAKMLSLHTLSAEDLKRADVWFGNFSADAINEFRKDISEHIDLVASHGHTVFHNPSEGYTMQIGDGNVIAKKTKIPTVFDFRSGDVALGGQGAPLVPIGDELLFGEYDACLNLGGFSNISMRNRHGERIAFDISPVNIIMNEYARKLGKNYDANGDIAASGKTIPALLKKLSAIRYYRQKPPKSLGREWVEKEMKPILAEYDSETIADMLNTLSVHIGTEIGKAIGSCGKVLVTGGGAYNKFLIDNISRNCNSEIIIPDDTTINYKEAIIFAFLGLLRLNGKNNCLSSITGAKKDSCCGVVATL